MNIEVAEQTFISYVAVILYESTSDSSKYQSMYQESFVLIKAISPEIAQQEALRYAQQQQTTYENEQQETIYWTLKHIVDISPLRAENVNFDNGSEIYFRHFRDYQAYTSFEPLLSGGL